jgi:hypothetical protein
VNSRLALVSAARAVVLTVEVVAMVGIK